MKTNKLIISVMLIGFVFLLTGTVAYFRNVINGVINVQTGKIVMNVTGFDDEITKTISLNEQGDMIMPGDSGSFTLTLNVTNSHDNVASCINIVRTNLPDNLKFYDSDNYNMEIIDYNVFLGIDNPTKELTIYWYWDGTVDNENDNLFRNVALSATLTVNSTQLDYGQMKSGVALIYDDEYDEWYPDYASSTEFWNKEYVSSIRSVTFSSHLANVPSTCNEPNLCWDISDTTSRYPIYAYMEDTGVEGIIGYDEELFEDIVGNLYDLYIVSSKPFFAPENCNGLLGFENAVSIEFGDIFITSQTTNMLGMFAGCYNLTSLDVSSFDTSGVTDMSYMFFGCSRLTSLDVSSFDTSGVTDMKDMFCRCSSLASLNLNNFNTSNVTDMNYMFSWCSNLASLNLSTFNTSSVINMSEMFYGCSSLTYLDLSSFDTSNVTVMNYMFCNCDSLNFTDSNAPYYIDLNALGADTNCEAVG